MPEITHCNYEALATTKAGDLRTIFLPKKLRRRRIKWEMIKKDEVKLKIDDWEKKERKHYIIKRKRQKEREIVGSSNVSFKKERSN